MTSLSKQNLKFRFLLIIIDVFSRFLWIEPVKDKTAKEVLNTKNKDLIEFCELSIVNYAICNHLSKSKCSLKY